MENNTLNLKAIKTWALMVTGIIICIVFLYQEPIINGQKLAIGDVKSQGLIFEKHKDNYQTEFGEHALWYPYIFCGMPFHASGTYRLQYTLETLYKIVPLSIRKSLSTGFTFNILAGAIFMLLLLRSYGLGYSASFFGAAAFVFTTKILGTPHTNRIVTFIHLPLILYAIRQLWNTKKWIFMVLLGGAVGSQIGSYHPQVAYYGLLMVGLYTLYRFVQGVREKESWKSLMTILGMTGVSLGVGYMMASIVLMPMQEYLPFSIRGAAGASGGGSGLSFDYATGWSFSWWEIFSFILPSFSGFGGGTYWGDMPFTSYPHYLGIPVVILAVIALITGKKRQDYWFFIMVLVFSLLMGMGKNISVLSSLLLNYLPYFNKFREPSMILILFAMSTAILSGWGLHILLEKFSEPNNVAWRKISLRSLIGIGVVAVIVLLFKDGLQNLMFGVYNNADISTDRIKQFQDPRQINYLYKMRFDMLYQDLWIAILLSAGTLGLIWGGLTKKILMKPFIAMLVILMIADLGFVGRKVIPPMFSKASRRAMEPRKTGVIDYLKKDTDLFRILPLDNFTTNEFAWFGISSIGGYHAAKMAYYQDFLDGKFISNLNFLRLTNTKYVITKQQFNHPELEFKHSAGGKNIYQVKHHLPRVFLVDSVVVSDDKNVTFDILKSDWFNPKKHAIVNQELPENQFSTYESKVKVVHWEPQKTVISASMTEAGLLAFSEGYYSPGWHAYIDGEKTDIYQTNHFMQSIIVPQGNHEVEFRFELTSFYQALWVSKIMFIGVLIILVGYGIWRYRNIIFRGKITSH